MNASRSLVWYAAYGSNLSRERLICYLEGEAPGPGMRKPGPCEVGAGILGDRPYSLPYPLYFARWSPDWKGAVAFVGLTRFAPAPTLGRVYLLSLPQLCHVAFEENGGRGEQVEITDASLKVPAVQIRERGWYRLLLRCGDLDGLPVVTLTGWPAEAKPVSQPSPAYLARIRSGLRETYPFMSEVEIEEYLKARSTVRSKE